MTKENVKNTPKFIGFLIALILLVVAVPVFQLVLGFTNPTANPPTEGGKLAASNDNLSISNARLVDVASPVASNDAANKAYVDAQVGGGGSTITLFGVSQANPTAASALRAGGALATCLRGIVGAGCTSAPQAPVSAGVGTPACSTLDTASSTWSELYAGYGPMNTMFSFYNTGQGGSDLTWPPEEGTAPDGGVVIGTDSICSTAPFANVHDIQYSQTNQFVQGSSAVLSACTTTDCNTCRVCIKD